MFGLWILVAAMIVACSIFIFCTWHTFGVKTKASKVMMTVMSFLVTLLVTAGCIFMMYFTAVGQRSWKTLISNVAGNIERVVTVYDLNGEVITTYEGNFDIDSSKDKKIMFDDQEGKRHTIYWTTGTVVIDEK